VTAVTAEVRIRRSSVRMMETCAGDIDPGGARFFDA
jgi:hypothetical protein